MGRYALAENIRCFGNYAFTAIAVEAEMRDKLADLSALKREPQAAWRQFVLGSYRFTIAGNRGTHTILRHGFEKASLNNWFRLRRMVPY